MLQFARMRTSASDWSAGLEKSIGLKNDRASTIVFARLAEYMTRTCSNTVPLSHAHRVATAPPPPSSPSLSSPLPSAYMANALTLARSSGILVVGPEGAVAGRKNNKPNKGRIDRPN